jgi:hypothetical protein
LNGANGATVYRIEIVREGTAMFRYFRNRRVKQILAIIRESY